MNRYIMMLVFIIVLGISLLGCSKITIPGGDGEDNTTIDISGAKDGEISIGTKGENGEDESMNIEADEEGNTKMTMKTEDGEMVSESGENAEIPEGFPEDFPLPDDVNITMSTTNTAEDAITYMVQFELTEDPEDLYNAVIDYADSKGLEISLDNQTEIDGVKTYMLGAGESDSGESDYFSFHLGQIEEQSGSVNYSVPNN